MAKKPTHTIYVVVGKNKIKYDYSMNYSWACHLRDQAVKEYPGRTVIMESES